MMRPAEAAQISTWSAAIQQSHHRTTSKFGVSAIYNSGLRELHLGAHSVRALRCGQLTWGLHFISDKQHTLHQIYINKIYFISFEVIKLMGWGEQNFNNMFWDLIRGFFRCKS